MKIAIIIIGIILMIFNLYLGKIHRNLHKRGIYKSYLRFSFKRLNDAISEVKDNTIKLELYKVKKIFKVYLMIFYIELVLLISTVVQMIISSSSK